MQRGNESRKSETLHRGKYDRGTRTKMLSLSTSFFQGRRLQQNPVSLWGIDVLFVRPTDRELFTFPWTRLERSKPVIIAQDLDFLADFSSTAWKKSSPRTFSEPAMTFWTFPFHRCPLYSDTIRLNAVAVHKMAEEAQKKVMEQNPNIKIDTSKLLPDIPNATAGPHTTVLNADELPVSRAKYFFFHPPHWMIFHKFPHETHRRFFLSFLSTASRSTSPRS